ncbi:MAG: hypothetical protein EPO07_02315 [Verrucomicrobia bacterium]|nr:MAG: hypothetical protein EPO07_02315 [Verrucomicrobiota bacterium]
MNAAIKIKLPDDLRKRIEDYKTALNAEIAGHAAQLEKAERELVNLQETESSLSSQIAMLETTTRHDDESGVAHLTNLQTRLSLLRNQLTAAETAVATARETKVALKASPLVKELFGFYAEQLPKVIAETLRPLFKDLPSADRFARETHAVAGLGSVRDWATWNALAAATPANMQYVFAILDRALAGSPNLGFDAPTGEWQPA